MNPWFRVPSWIGGRLSGDHVATDAEAWVDLLGRWHQGEDISICAFQRATGWGKSRTLAFMPKVAEWAVCSGASVPSSWSKKVSDRQADQNQTGSCARIPLEREKEETEKRSEKEIPPTPQTDPGWIGRAFEQALGPPSPKPPERPSEPLPEPKATTEPKSVLIGAPIASGGTFLGHPTPREERDLISLLSGEPNGPQLVRCLFEAGIKSLEELQEIGPKKLQYCPGVGPGRKAQICRALAKQGIFLVDRIEAPVQPQIQSKSKSLIESLRILKQEENQDGQQFRNH